MKQKKGREERVYMYVGERVKVNGEKKVGGLEWWRRKVQDCPTGKFCVR